MKHIPTLTLNLYSENNHYTYEYDDIHGNTQEEGMFVDVGEALKHAAKNLKTFTFIGIETK
jgi:hypothetical protein